MKQYLALLIAFCSLYTANSYAVEWSFGDSKCDADRYSDMVHQVFREVGLVPDGSYITKSSTVDISARRLRGAAPEEENEERHLQYAMCSYCEARYWAPNYCVVYWGVCNNGRRELETHRELPDTTGVWSGETFDSMKAKCADADAKFNKIKANDCDMKSFYCIIHE